MDARLKIAHCVESYAPAPGGMAEVVKQLSERMVKAGHDVTVFTSFKTERSFEILHGVQIRSYKISGNAVSGIQGEKAQYIRDVVEGDYDVVVLFAAQQWSADLLLPILPQIKAAKVFVPTGFSMLYNANWSGYFDQMKMWMQNIDMNVFLSENYRDAQFAEKHHIRNRMLIPNGAAEEEFESTSLPDIRTKWTIPANHSILLHVGSFVTSKGQLDAMRIFYKSGIRKSTLLMIGNGADHFWKQIIRHPLLYLKWRWSRIFGSQQVIFDSATREETVAAYQAADLFLFPSKIECSPIVLFEAMASRTPFLVTDVGNSREIARWGEGGWIMPGNQAEDGFTQADIAESAKQLRDIISHKEDLKVAQDKGYQAWKNKFTWQIIANTYVDLYQSLKKKKSLKG